MIQKELIAGRPVLYSGQSTAGGHAFVLDGCDENDMYHLTGDGADMQMDIIP